MAAGRDHDRATVVVALPLALVLSVGLGAIHGLSTALAFLIGGLWLSPDLDTHCRALNRWGVLQWIWWPYRRLIPHRSLWSHGPILGTVTRLLLLSAWVALTLAVLPGVSLSEALGVLLLWCQRNPSLVLAVLVGLDASCWLHLILDGDPLPAEWHRWRSRRHRRR
ncbi:metal-binding protein [Parasynechococcus sp.]|jgi:uncharacterized metal-binding protein|uniref:metal-binding protein n=1 Tax=Parasynechococcus sp. TaxID=3101203 RepID=UPI003704058D